jgi:thiamine monophosphate synthase
VQIDCSSLPNASVAGCPELANDRITISCQVSDIELVWQLAEAGTGTAIHVTVSLPEREARRLDGQHQIIGESLRRLAALAEAAA